MSRLLGWIACAIGDHKWTCLAEQGIKPDPDRVKADPLGYFWEYAAMYCARCQKRSTLR